MTQSWTVSRLTHPVPGQLTCQYGSLEVTSTPPPCPIIVQPRQRVPDPDPLYDYVCPHSFKNLADIEKYTKKLEDLSILCRLDVDWDGTLVTPSVPTSSDICGEIWRIRLTLLAVWGMLGGVVSIWRVFRLFTVEVFDARDDS